MHGFLRKNVTTTLNRDRIGTAIEYKGSSHKGNTTELLYADGNLYTLGAVINAVLFDDSVELSKGGRQSLQMCKARKRPFPAFQKSTNDVWCCFRMNLKSGNAAVV